MTGPISVEEIQDAERRLIKIMQAGMNVDFKRIQNPSPFLGSDGIWKASGRLQNIRNLPQEIRNPTILPKKHRLVRLLLEHYHQKLGHCGYRRLVAEIRQKYWVIGLRDMAKFLVGSCIACRKMRRRRCQQLLGQLPSYRTEVHQPAFMNIALDLSAHLR